MGYPVPGTLCTGYWVLYVLASEYWMLNTQYRGDPGPAHCVRNLLHETVPQQHLRQLRVPLGALVALHWVGYGRVWLGMVWCSLSSFVGNENIC